jgi:calcineurin-like phosphoesterase family protein
MNKYIIYKDKIQKYIFSDYQIKDNNLISINNKKINSNEDIITIMNKSEEIIDKDSDIVWKLI